MRADILMRTNNCQVLPAEKKSNQYQNESLQTSHCQ